MLVGMASEISKNYTYKCVDRIAQDTMKSRVPRLSVHTNQILALAGGDLRPPSPLICKRLEDYKLHLL